MSTPAGTLAHRSVFAVPDAETLLDTVRWVSGAWLKKKFPHAGLQLGTGQHALDESSLLLSQAAYDDQGAEYAKPTLRLGRERFTGGLAMFFDTTDVF